MHSLKQIVLLFLALLELSQELSTFPSRAQRGALSDTHAPEVSPESRVALPPPRATA